VKVKKTETFFRSWESLCPLNSLISAMPRVLRIINRFNVGGPTYNAAYLTRDLAPEFETLLAGGVPLTDEAHSGYILDEIGVKYLEIPEMSRSISFVDDWKAFKKIRKLIKEFQPDIVHTHAAKAGALGRLAARTCSVSVVVHTFHGHVLNGYFSPFKSLLVRLMEKFLARLSSSIITISQSQKDDITTKFGICTKKKAVVIRLGFDLEKFSENKEEKRRAFRKKYSIEEDEVAVGIIGRFAPVKNHKLFFASIEVLAKLSNQKINAVLVGDGSNKNSLVQLGENISKKHAHIKFTFTSWIKDVDIALAGLDIIALTSLNEGTPVSLIEAQAAGRPIVTTSVGGIGDCMLDGQSGWICKGFEADEFASLLYKLAQNTKIRDEFGHSGKEFVMKHYHSSRLADDMRALYERLLKEHG
jgi:glycosyltransferase involved in cell wall biosynthesis